MTRLIDADALIKILEFNSWNIDEWELPHEQVSAGLLANALDREIVEEAPTVDAVPVRHGKWIIRENPGTGWYRITCSECGEDVTSTAPCIGFFPNAKVSWDYCPDCGARMDAE